MSGTDQILLRHAAKYPKMEVRDAVKLLYQGEFGCGHLVASSGGSMACLRQEMQRVRQDGSQALCEDIGGEFCRLHLSALDSGEEQLLAVNRALVASASQPVGNPESFRGKLAGLNRLAGQGLLPFSAKEVESYLEEYEKAGMPAVHHSGRYREVYNPAYRVIRKEFAACFDVITAIEKLLIDNPAPVIAIDGPCGSGKTTLAGLLAELYNCQIIPMDDFFLPPELRAPERLEEPGGNIHYERFEEEVAGNLKSGSPFAYRVFDCSIMDYAGEKTVKPSLLTICEGSYSMHPRFGSLYDLRIFVTCPRKEQNNRLLARGGEALYQRFQQEWIPMENRYFDAYRIRESCQAELDTTALTF